MRIIRSKFSLGGKSKCLSRASKEEENRRTERNNDPRESLDYVNHVREVFGRRRALHVCMCLLHRFSRERVCEYAYRCMCVCVLSHHGCFSCCAVRAESSRLPWLAQTTFDAFRLIFRCLKTSLSLAHSLALPFISRSRVFFFCAHRAF